MEKEELISKYNINIQKLEEEQKSLSQALDISDYFDLSDIKKIGAIQNIMIKNQIISAMVVVDENLEIIEQEYFIDKLRFPFLYGFRAYRELPTMTGVYNKLRDKPDIVLIQGTGINHSRLGLASHFSLLTGVPTISINDSFFDGNEINETQIVMSGREVGRKIITKPGSKPLYVSPGNKISVKSSVKFINGLIRLPHKMPEPMHLAHKYSQDIKKELKFN